MGIDSVTETAESWRPLEAVLGEHWCDEFMWMGAAGGVQLYKHTRTRRYLRIDGQGNFYDQHKQLLNRSAAIKFVLS